MPIATKLQNWHYTPLRTLVSLWRPSSRLSYTSVLNWNELLARSSHHCLC